MAVINTILTVILLIVDVALIVMVLMQDGKSAGLGAISGGAETLFGRRKAKSYEAKLALATKILAVMFIVLSVGLLLVERFSIAA